MLAGAKLEEERNTRLCEALNWVIRRKCEVHSGGQAHVGHSQLTGGVWDRAGHHQSPHYEAHCAYQVYKDHMHHQGRVPHRCIGKVLSLCFMNVGRLLFQYGVKKWLLILIITNTDRVILGLKEQGEVGGYLSYV